MNSALSRAEIMLQELKNNFLEDLPGKFDHYEYTVMEMKNKDHFVEYYDEIYRSIHSLKGTAGTFDMQIFTTICHQLEDQIQLVDGDAQKFTPELFNNWLEYIDLMRQAYQEIIHGRDSLAEIEKHLLVLRKKAYADDLTCLLVNSSKTLNDVCMGILTEQGIRVSIMENGYLALGRLLQEKFDLLVTSKETTGLNGRALVSALRLSDSINKHIHTILVTTQSNMSLKRDTDPDAVLEKNPELIPNLINLVETCKKKARVPKAG